MSIIETIQLICHRGIFDINYIITMVKGDE